MYNHQLKEWPNFSWDKDIILPLLAGVRFKQGKLLGKMEQLGFETQSESVLNVLTQDVIKSSEIEGEALDKAQVRSSIARRLGMDIGGLVFSDRNVDGVVEMMLDASQNYTESLSFERLFAWHSALFPNGRSGMFKIIVGDWRKNSEKDPMQVVSGPMGRERVHFQAPSSDRLPHEMQLFVDWFNEENVDDFILKAAIAHLWFVTIHPFEDGNGRMSRALADMLLCRSDETSKRFYSMSSQIRKERTAYYDILEDTQHGDLNITEWLKWFLDCLERAIEGSDEILQTVLQKAQLWQLPISSSFNERQRLMLNKLIDGFDGKLTSSKWAKITKCSQDTASRDIQDLVQKGVLVKDAAGGRSTNYLLVEKF